MYGLTKHELDVLTCWCDDLAVAVDWVAKMLDDDVSNLEAGIWLHNDDLDLCCVLSELHKKHPNQTVLINYIDLKLSIDDIRKECMSLPRHHTVLEIHAILSFLQAELQSDVGADPTGCGTHTPLAIEEAVESITDCSWIGPKLAKLSSEFNYPIRMAAARLRSHFAGEYIPDSGHTQYNDDDGPTTQGCFSWKGKTYDGLTPVPWNVLKYIWDCDHRCGSFDDFPKHVWNDINAEKEEATIRGYAHKLSTFFKTNNIPLKCMTAKESRTICIKPFKIDSQFHKKND